jgi:two-component system osmolarity sensor histidine kinase EnvZ
VDEVSLTGAPVVTVRPDAFRRCLFNLASNAARYGETVAISGKLETRSFFVSIDDDGPGIPVESREEVFKPFLRLDDARQDAGGSGLGLAIARDIARAHGGDITLHDGPLGGLRATVRVPA